MGAKLLLMKYSTTFILFLLFSPILLIAQEGGTHEISARDILEHLALKKDVPNNSSWTYISAEKDIEICLNRFTDPNRLSVTFYEGLGKKDSNNVVTITVEGGKIAAREHTGPGKTRRWKPERKKPGQKTSDTLLDQFISGLNLALEIDIKKDLSMKSWVINLTEEIQKDPRATTNTNSYSLRAGDNEVEVTLHNGNWYSVTVSNYSDGRKLWSYTDLNTNRYFEWDEPYTGEYADRGFFVPYITNDIEKLRGKETNYRTLKSLVALEAIFGPTVLKLFSEE